MSEAGLINDWLKSNYGYTIDGKPIFRVVWSNTQLETIFDTFTDFYGPLFLRKVTEVRTVPKYQHLKNRWLLEKIVFIESNEMLILKDKFSYECIYAFQDKNGEPLPLIRKAVEMILYAYSRRDRDKLKKAILTEEDRKDEIEKDYFRQKIGEGQQIPHLMDLVY